MADFERITIRAQVSRDANHVDAIDDQSFQFSAVPDYFLLREIQLGPGSSRTILEADVGNVTDIERFFIWNKPTSGAAVRISFTDSQAQAASIFCPAGEMAMFCSVSTDVVLLNLDAADGDPAELVIYASGS